MLNIAKAVTLVLVIVLTTSKNNSFAQTQDSIPKWTILPESHIVPLFTADSRAHRLSIQKPISDNGYIASMGGIFPIFSREKNKRIIQFSGASTVYTTLRRWTDRGRLINIDFFVDLYLDFKLNDHWAIRTGAGHTSQHLSDDAIQDGLKQINYTRDYGQVFGVYSLPQYRFFCYGGWIFNNSFKTTSNMSPVSMFQFGFEHSPLKWFDNNYLYYAADIKFRGEMNYKTIQNYQLGYKYARPGKHTLRGAINYSTGLDERGQFYTQYRELLTTGVFLDF
jgi:hypothetical protein